MYLRARCCCPTPSIYRSSQIRSHVDATHYVQSPLCMHVLAPCVCCTHAYVYVHVYMHTHAYVYMHAHTHRHMYTHLHIHHMHADAAVLLRAHASLPQLAPMSMPRPLPYRKSKGILPSHGKCNQHPQEDHPGTLSAHTYTNGGCVVLTCTHTNVCLCVVCADMYKWCLWSMSVCA
jgi:hypothetical protein